MIDFDNKENSYYYYHQKLEVTFVLVVFDIVVVLVAIDTAAVEVEMEVGMVVLMVVELEQPLIVHFVPVLSVELGLTNQTYPAQVSYNIVN